MLDLPHNGRERGGKFSPYGAFPYSFAHDTNAVTIFGADGSAQDVPLQDKRAIARAVLEAVVQRLPNPDQNQESQDQ